MPGVINTTYTFTSTDVITSDKMNNIVDESIFTSDAVISNCPLTVSSNKLTVKAGGITANEMATGSVVTASIVDSAVTTAKIADTAITTAKITDLNVTTGKIATAAIGTKAELEASTASKLVAADLVKHSPPVAKAYGSFTIASSARTLTGSLNVSVSRIDTNESQVTFLSSMSNNSYTVITQSTHSSSTDPGAIDGNPIIYNKTTTGFKILHSPEATNRAIDFVVFGGVLA